jgi:hypothetical protein
LNSFGIGDRQASCQSHRLTALRFSEHGHCLAAAGWNGMVTLLCFAYGGSQGQRAISNNSEVKRDVKRQSKASESRGLTLTQSTQSTTLKTSAAAANSRVPGPNTPIYNPKSSFEVDYARLVLPPAQSVSTPSKTPSKAPPQWHLLSSPEAKGVQGEPSPFLYTIPPLEAELYSAGSKHCLNT